MLTAHSGPTQPAFKKFYFEATDRTETMCIWVSIGDLSIMCFIGQKFTLIAQKTVNM